MQTTVALTLVSALLITGCTDSVPSIVIPKSYSIGDDLSVTAVELKPMQEYTLFVDRIDRYERIWTSSATFIADAYGVIDLDNLSPAEGPYTAPDVYGHLYSMTMPSPPGDDWIAPTPKDYATLTYSLIHESDTLDQASLRQWIIPPDIKKETTSEPIVAEVFIPDQVDSTLSAILLLGGSGGGLSWASRMGSLLAGEGYIAMALAYFNAEGLPSHLAQIPLEYVEQAIALLAQRSDTDPNRIGLLGYSKGAELALLMASRNKEIRCVASIAPGSAVFQGFKPPKFPVISSWSYNGKDLPFVPNAYDDRFFRTYDGMYLWYQTLSQHEVVNQAAIPVENINGDILLISGVEDRIWPTTYMSEQIVARLYVAQFKHEYQHISFANAGHGIAEPPGYPTTGLSERLGGTPEGNSKAREKMWVELKNFFRRSLKER